ncbi:MAG TPA: alpha/beta fold hydrolase [Spirochaetota bacterium]|nr:alpha/beta fold hydrolase [Spirochaetota bacterium]
MALSRFMLGAAKITLDAVFKASAADIRVHNVERIPAASVIYVVNHFTRMETAFLPYIIFKHTGKHALSLAHHSFFKGKLEKFLHKMGAVSTKDPDRDLVLTNAMLTGNMSLIIFPEGQMIKDKKLIEKGKYLVYNAGIRRPPHTGAAIIALKSEIIRQLMKKLYNERRMAELEIFKEAYKIEKNDLDGVIAGSTYIVPVNITYYPIRARNNTIKRLVEKFAGQVSGRTAEELEVEGTMLTRGVDIDINFGKAIRAQDYLKKTTMVRDIIKCGRQTCFDEFTSEKTVKKLSVKIMQEYMQSIYSMTTVNHDHIFAYILLIHPTSSIPDYDFKNRASLAIEKIKELKLTSFHSTLLKRNENIGADIFHEKYDSFIEEALKCGLVKLKGTNIVRVNSKFTPTYNFHNIRQDNFIEVLKNEIEPLKELTGMLRRIMIMPPWMVKRMVHDTFSKLDLKIFRTDYKKYYREGETRTERNGAPFFFHNVFNKYGVILVHGYMAAPGEVRLLAERLYAAGYSVYGVRLRGHGTTPEDLAHMQWQDWYESVNRGYVVMKNAVNKFVIAGFSTGAGLALLQAAKKNEKFSGLISINAPLKLQNIKARLSGPVSFFNTIVKKFNMGNGKLDFVPNHPDNPEINYRRNPVHGVAELGKLMKVVEESLHKIRIPALVIQAANDPVVNPESADAIFEKINSTRKELVKINADRHGILSGDELDEVVENIIPFLKKVFR